MSLLYKYVKSNYLKIIFFSLIYFQTVIPQTSFRLSLTENNNSNRLDNYLSREEPYLSNHSEFNINNAGSIGSFLTKRKTCIIQEKQLQDTLDLSYIPWVANEHLGVAATELAFIQFLPWAMAKWVREWENPEENWANVSGRSWWNNIRSGWEYDGDAFLTNYFAHPYHGNLYFNVGRTNGYSFWGSSLWALSGSLLWEFFAETYRPAFNDWINTSFNGTNLGEMLYRISSVITDNNATGYSRAFQEIAGALINPVRGLNRLLSGETTRIFPNSEESNPKGFLIKIDAGARQLEKGSDSNQTQNLNEGLISTDIYYGNLYYSNLKIPFTWFSISAALSTREPVLTNLQSFGSLFGWHIKEGVGSRYSTLITLNYNYFNNPGFNYGGTSINPHLISNYKIGNEISVVTNFDLELIAMGGTPTDYYIDVEGRDYDFGPGIGGNIGASLNKGAWSVIRLFYSSKMIWTQSEPSGSKHHLQMVWVDLSYPIINKLGIGIGIGYYLRNSYYKDEPDIFKSNRIIRLVLKSSFF